MFAFIKALAGAHGKKAVQQVIDKTVELDPSTATEAQLKVMEDDLKAASALVAKLQTASVKEEREAADIRKRYDLQLRGAEMLWNEYNGLDPSDPKRAELGASLEAMAGELETLKADVEIEEAEAVEAKQFLAEAESVLKEKGQALLEAKKNMTKAARSLEQANLRKDRANAQAETAAQVAGLRDGQRTSLNGALTALQSQADKANAEAAAARLRAEALKKPQLGTSSDPNVQRALEAAKRGGALPSPENLGSRLAALGAPIPTGQAALPAPSETAAS